MISCALLGALSVAACSDDESTGNAALDESIVAWHGVRDEAGGNYTYSRIGFEPTDEGYRMTFTVEHNAVVSRAKEPISEGAVIAWTESEAELGSHDGFEVLTIDELYDRCAAYVARDPALYEVELDFFSNDVLRTCIVNPVGVYIPEGFTIDTFATLL
jgi:hypothetical protein